MAKKDKAKVEVAAPAPTPAGQDGELLLVSRALSDPKRIELLRRIANADHTTCMDLRTCLCMNPATLSHHMRQLEGAGLIETERDGKFVRATLKRKAWKNYVGLLKQFTT